MNIIQRGSGILLLLSMVISTYGHPGHSAFDEGLGHLVKSPYHVISMGALAALLFLLSAWASRTAIKRGLIVAGSSCLVAATVLLLFR